MNANDAALTEMITAQAGSRVEDHAPNAPAHASFDLVIEGIAGAAIGGGAAPYKLRISVLDLTTVTQPWADIVLSAAFDPASHWTLSGGGPDYEYTQVFSVPVPSGAGGPLSGHVLQYTASLVTTGAQIVSIVQSDPFVLV
jgi:hypothetical protein